MFTDAEIIGSTAADALGPYRLFNTVPARSNLRELRPSIVLRAEDHIPADTAVLLDMSRTDSSAYHGGALEDEIAALISLCLGIRARAGGPARSFRDPEDPRGTPIAWWHQRTPVLPDSRTQPVLPAAIGRHNLGDADRISILPKLTLEAATALIKAARAYQAALWIAELDPSLCWVMLVSAVETAATHWRSSKDSSLDRLRASHQPLYELLVERGGESLAQEVANYLVNYLGSTKRFVDFISAFAPEPPPERPEVWYQFNFESQNVKVAMRKIYDHRSKALHAATPFPFPMCEMPTWIGTGGVQSEVPVGLAAHTLGATWIKEDMPMTLNAFEHIARGALLNWWASNVGKDPVQTLARS